MAIPENIEQLANDVRTKVYGREVREALASGIEAAGSIANDADVRSQETETKQTNLEKKYDEQIANMSLENPSVAEVVDARVSGYDGQSYTTIGKRFDSVDAQLAQMMRDLAPYNVKDFGALGDGVTDDSDAIQAAVDTAFDDGGGLVVLPHGVYILSKPIYWRSNISLIGAGIGKSILKPIGSTSFSAIQNIDQTKDDPLVNCTFMNFEIDGSGIDLPYYSLGSKGLFILYIRRALFQNLYIHDTIGTGLGCDFLDDSIIDNVVVENCGRLWEPGQLGGAGIGIGTGAWEDNEGLVISNCHARNCGNYGIFCEHQWTGIYAKFIRIENCSATGGKNIGISNKGNWNMVVSNCIMSDNATSGFAVEDYSKDCILSDCIITDNGRHGIEFNHRIQNYKIDNCIIARNANRGIYALFAWGNMSNLTIKNNDIYENFAGVSLVNSVGYSVEIIELFSNKVFRNNSFGIEISVPITNFWIENNKVFDNGINPGNESFSGFGVVITNNATNISIKNNHIYDSRQSDGKTQKKGIVQIETSTFFNGTVESNDCQGNISGGLELAGANINVMRRFNKGDVNPPSHSGGVSIPNGATYALVPHNMGIPPHYENIIVTPVNNLGVATKFWISGIDDTHFRINVDKDPGIDTAKFAWMIIY